MKDHVKSNPHNLIQAGPHAHAKSKERKVSMQHEENEERRDQTDGGAEPNSIGRSLSGATRQ